MSRASLQGFTLQFLRLFVYRIFISFQITAILIKQSILMDCQSTLSNVFEKTSFINFHVKKRCLKMTNELISITKKKDWTRQSHCVFCNEYIKRNNNIRKIMY